MSETVKVNLLTRNVVVGNPYLPECKDDYRPSHIILKPKDNPHEIKVRLAEILVSRKEAEYA